jgi:malonyl-CoA decarboxylase
LRGVSFGNLLIKQVVEDLGREFPRLRTFATLSPIPGFVRWLASGDGSERPKMSSAVERLVAGSEREDTIASDMPAEAVRDEIKRLCAHYLLHARHGNEAYDPVARFHLTNGARLERLNWMGDTSPSGIKRSLGLMVNYVYRLDDLEKNHEAYATLHQIVASAEFRRLAASARRDAQALRRLSRSNTAG